MSASTTTITSTSIRDIGARWSDRCIRLTHAIDEAGAAHPRLSMALAGAIPVVVATPIAMALHHWSDGDTFDVMLLAVVVATFSGGIRSGLLAIVLATFSLDFLVIGPRFHFSDGLDVIDSLTFIGASVLIGTLYSAMRSARLKAESAMRTAEAARAELAGTARDLRLANETKDEFLGLVSHELKTPLTTIVMDGGILRSRGDELDPDLRAMMAAEICDEGQRLARIIDNLLVLARGGEVTTEPVLLGRLVKRVITRHQSLHPERGITVDIEPDVVVVAQPLHVEQVVLNLLSNAEKYSPATTTIVVSVRSRDGEAAVTVADEGRGISESEAPRIFDAFYRSSSTAQDRPGLGVGLAVCKRLVEAQSGRIWAARGDHGGAAFTFTLPLFVEPAVASPV